MNSEKPDITAEELSQACGLIRQRFSAHSWWPGEQPGEAKREFELMKNSAEALNVWCGRWLSTGQWQKMKSSLRS